MKIAVYAIAKDEAAHAARFAASAAAADVIFVADSGSSDGTVEALRAAGAQVTPIGVTPWRFDDARNAALALVPADVDVCVSLDLDEVLAPGWRGAIEAAWTPGVTRLAYDFICDRLPDGSPGTRFRNNRVHARHGYRWRHACHEGLYPDRINEAVAFAPGLEVEHRPDQTKSRASYLPLLFAAAIEEPGSARMAFYLGREYLFAGELGRASTELRRYLAMDVCFPPERAMAMVYLARAALRGGKADEGYRWLMRACGEAPDYREPWVALAHARWCNGEAAAAYAAALTALAIEEHPGGFIGEADSWGSLPHWLASWSAHALGLAGASALHAARAAELETAPAA